MGRTAGVLLYSGGLDSVLAGKVLQQQGIDIIGLFCILPFYPADIDYNEMPAVKFAKKVGIPLEFYRCGDEYLDMIKSPPHGYGKNMNPCIDCKIFFLKQASALMERIEGDFVATGDVVGQRPMSQQKNMLIHIERKSGLIGRLLRPLSAKLMKPTIPELEKRIDRDALFGINGRGRKMQMELAEKMGITEYATPAGGCLFTDRNYSKKLKDIISTGIELHTDHLYALMLGRYFKIGKNSRAIISRNEWEGNELLKLSNLADYIFNPDFKGPIGFVLGDIDNDEKKMVGSIISAYGSPLENDNIIRVKHRNETVELIDKTDLMDETILQSIRY